MGELTDLRGTDMAPAEGNGEKGRGEERGRV